MFRRFKDILEMIRFSHTIFALPFALLAAVMAWTARSADGARVPFRWLHLVGIVICMVMARSAAMAFNRLADRRIDAANARTRHRHLPAGILPVGAVVLFTVACSVGFVAATLLFLPNRLPLLFSLPVLAFLLGYSYTKRFTTLTHFWLGAALMLAPVAAWIAIRGQRLAAQPAEALPALVLGLAVLLWVAGFDMIYACQDVEFDRRAKLFSMPAKRGLAGALRAAALCHLGMILALFALPLVPSLSGLYLDFGWIYGCGVALVALLLVYEHWVVRPDDLTRVNIAFFNINAIVSIGLFLVATVDLLV